MKKIEPGTLCLLVDCDPRVAGRIVEAIRPLEPWELPPWVHPETRAWWVRADWMVEATGMCRPDDDGTRRVREALLVPITPPGLTDDVLATINAPLLAGAI